MPNWDPEANDLFLRALEITAPEDRGRFLDEACAGNPALRDRVDGLIRAGEQAGSFLEHPALDSGPTSAQSPSSTGQGTPAPREAGTVILLPRAPRRPRPRVAAMAGLLAFPLPERR